MKNKQQMWTWKDTAYLWRLPLAVMIALPFIILLVWLNNN